MGVRAMWKAELQVGSHAIPVKLYAAIDDRKVHFRLLDEATQAPVVQQMVDAATDEPLVEGKPQKGIQLDEGVFVVLTPDELVALEPQESRSIDIERFVPTSAVSDTWYERPYWLGPDGNEAAYFALVQALAEADRVGIAHWVMRKHRYQGALRVNGQHLMLVRLRHTEEVVPASALTAPTGRAADPREVALAEQLVAALEGPFDPSELEGTYQERVRELVLAKAAGKVVSIKQARAKKVPKGSLASALQASLKQVGRAGGARG